MKLVPIAYLASYFLSLLGNSIAAVAFPLIVLQVTGSVLGAGAVAASAAVPAILAGLFMGVIIDRINRRTSSVVTDLISAAAIAALPIVDLITGLSLSWFIIFAIIGSLGDVPGMTARETLLPAVVRHSGVTAERIMGMREALGALAMVVGPAAAGTLMVLLDGVTVLWITAATSFAAALMTLVIPRAVGAIDNPAAGQTPARGWQQLRDGWRVLGRSRFLVATTALSVSAVLILTALQGLILPVYFTVVDRPGMLGFVLTSLAMGMLIGGSIFAAVGTRGSRRGWLIVSIIGTTAGFAAIATLESVWVVFAGAALLGAANGVFGAMIGVLMIERIPEAMRGRIMGTQNAIMTAAPPIGLVGAALVTDLISLSAAAVVTVGVWFVALTCFLLPLLRNLDSDHNDGDHNDGDQIDGRQPVGGDEDSGSATVVMSDAQQ